MNNHSVRINFGYHFVCFYGYCLIYVRWISEGKWEEIGRKKRNHLSKREPQPEPEPRLFYCLWTSKHFHIGINIFSYPLSKVLWILPYNCIALNRIHRNSPKYVVLSAVFGYSSDFHWLHCAHTHTYTQRQLIHMPHAMAKSNVRLTRKYWYWHRLWLNWFQGAFAHTKQNIIISNDYYFWPGFFSYFWMNAKLMYLHDIRNCIDKLLKFI